MSDVLLFNKQIVLALKAGLPIAIGNRSKPSQVLSLISEINQRSAGTNPDPISSTIDQGKPPGLEDDDIPTEYREAYFRWLQNGRNISALGPMINDGQLRLEARWNIIKIVVPTLVIALLFSLLMPVILSRLLPDLHRFHEINGLKNSSSLQFLDYLKSHSWLVSLLPLVPLVVLWLFWLQPLRISKSLPATPAANETSAPQQQMPPPSLHAVSLSRTALIVQRQLARNQLSRWAPTIVATLIGGTIVAFYAICVIWPLADLIYLLSTTHG